MNLPTTKQILQVAVPTPLRKSFDYLLPENCNIEALTPGIRVQVPFGKRSLVGILLGTKNSSATPQEQLKQAESLLDEQPILGTQLLELCRWSAAYYQHPIGEVIAAALPKHLRSGRDLPSNGWRLTRRGLGLPPGAMKRAAKRAKALEHLQSGAVDDRLFVEQEISKTVLRELSKLELIERCAVTSRQKFDVQISGAPALSKEQADAIDGLELGSFSAHLLDGITGSGKTEVYLQLIARTLARGEQALVLVPEIGLTPQTLERFEKRFDAPIVALHSGIADGERLERWQRGRLGNAAIVIGTRSAVFAPLAKLGLIVVDEEHDGSYKQQDGFRYSARDIAVKRAQLEDCPVLLGSATPSLESVSNCQRGRYVHHRLSERQGGGALPILQTIDLRGQTLQSGISDSLMLELQETIRSGKQALLFLNRRGYAPTLQCHDCGWIAGCQHCDTRLTVHLQRRQLLCHHCGFRRKLMSACDECGSRALLAKGLGTEQLDAFLSQQLNCPIHRIDSDNAKGGSAANTFAQLREDPSPCVILGTQMLTKGHHFPHVQLVGIVDTDALLHGTDFRGPERMAQLVTQVAGRAGREQVGGLVLLQTHYPDDPLLAMLMKGGYRQISDNLLSARARQKLPPHGQLFMLRTDSKSEKEGEDLLSSIKRDALPLIPRSCQVIGPLPSALPRRAGRFRHQIWCMSPARADAQIALSKLIACAEKYKRSSHTNWFVDVDPQDVV